MLWRRRTVGGPWEETRYCATPGRPPGPLEPPHHARSCGITFRAISTHIMSFRIPPHWIRNLRWYSLIATTFALAWSWAWGIDVVLHSLMVAVALQFVAIVLDRN